MEVRRAMSTANGFKQSSEDWQLLSGLWDRAALIRVFLWHQQYADAKALLVQFLVRLRRFYSIDFCSGGLVGGEILTAAAVPEAGLEQLPGNFAARCLNLVAHARVPVTWNEVKAEFGFRSMVVAPVVAPSQTPIGFLMLGHTSRRVYSAAELFVLQSLAGELAWVARVLHSQEEHRGQLADLTQNINNTWQLIVGYTELIRQNFDGALGREQEQIFVKIESDIERMRWQLSQPPAVLSTDQDAPELVAPLLAKPAAKTKKNSVP